MNVVPDTIKDLLIVMEEQLKHPLADKKAARRTRAALETAYYCALAVFPNRGAETATGPENASKGACICPAGATDRRACPVHRA
jgi:hypothetical protein